MAKTFGSIVLLVRGLVTVNALVVQSVMQGTEEHLTLVSLDPAKASPFLSGMNVDAAIRRDFVTPLTEGKTFGWKDLPDPVLPTGGEPSEGTSEAGPADFNAALQQATRIINHQDDKIDTLEKELASIKAELFATTEGIDKQLQGIADATAKEAAPEATENPTSTGPTSAGPTETANPSETNTSEVGNLSPFPSPDQPSADTLQDSGTSESQPGSTSDNSLPG